MNIVFNSHLNDSVQCLGGVLYLCGYNVTLWDDEKKPVFDMVDEIHPELIFVDSHRITPIFTQAILEKEIPTIIYGVNVPDSLRNYTKCLLVGEEVPNHLLKNVDFKYFVLNKCADYTKYRGGAANYSLGSDLVYISNTQLDKQVNKWLYFILFELKIPLKIFSTKPQFAPSLNEYLGLVDYSLAMDIMLSSKCVLDINSNIEYDCAANKIPCISNNGTVCPSFNKNKDEFTTLLSKVVDSEKWGRKQIRKCYEKVINNDTCFHRMCQIAKEIGNNEMADKVMTTFNRVRQ